MVNSGSSYWLLFGLTAFWTDKCFDECWLDSIGFCFPALTPNSAGLELKIAALRRRLVDQMVSVNSGFQLV